MDYRLQYCNYTAKKTFTPLKPKYVVYRNTANSGRERDNRYPFYRQIYFVEMQKKETN